MLHAPGLANCALLCHGSSTLKLQGFVVTVPIFDARPSVQKDSILPVLSRPILEEDEHGKRNFLKGFGFARERSAHRLDWRPEDSAYYDCRWAISFRHNHLPDYSPSTHVVRRLFHDGVLRARLEVGLYTNPTHHKPKSKRRLDEYVRNFWDNDVSITKNRTRTLGKLGASLLLLTDKFVQMTSLHDTAESQLCHALPYQIQVIAEASERERPSHATPVDEQGRVFAAFRQLRVDNSRVNVAYFTYPPGYINKPPGDEFLLLRKIRALGAWTHSDCECIAYLLRCCTLKGEDQQVYGDCLLNLLHLVQKRPDSGHPDYPAFIAMHGLQTSHYSNRLTRLLDYAARSGLTESKKRQISSLVNEYLSVGRLYAPKLSKPMGQDAEITLDDRIQQAFRECRSYFDDLAEHGKSTRKRRYNDSRFAKSAFSKAKEALRLLHRELPSLRDRKLIIVSIGGADGTELISLLRNSRSVYGCLLEFMDRSTQDARQKALEAGVQIETFTGDLLQKLDDAMEWAIERKAETGAPVVVTAHAVLHELETRSSVSFSPRRFFARLHMADVVIGREPIEPSNWPDTVLLSGKFDADLFVQLAGLIRQRVKGFDRPDFTCDRVNSNTVETQRTLGMETLTKAFYSEDFLYEMEEWTTSLTSNQILSALNQCLKDKHSVGHELLTSHSVNDFWECYGLEARSSKEVTVGKPLSHVRYWAFRKNLGA